MAEEGKSDKIQVSEEFAARAASQSEALSGLGQSTFASSIDETPLTEKIEVVKPTEAAGQPGESNTEVSKQTPGENAGDNPADDSGQKQQPAKTDQDQKNEGAAGDDKGEEEFVLDSPIIGGKKTIGAKKEEEPGDDPGPEFKSIEDVDAFAKEKGYKDAKHLASELPKIMQVQKEFETVSLTNKKYETLFENMPPRMFEAFKLWSNGEDWESFMATADSVNYENDFSKHDSVKMVEKYFPGKITKEEWDEYNDKDGDQVVKDKVDSYLGLSKDKYSLDQEKFNTHKENLTKNATAVLEARKQSMEASREGVKKAFESSNLNIDDKYIGSLDNVLANDRAILSLFKNDDGTLKPDAHQKLAMANDGFGLVVQYQKHIERRVVSKTREEIIERTGSGSQAVKKSGDSAGANQLQESEKKVKQYVDSVLPTGTGQTFS